MFSIIKKFKAVLVLSALCFGTASAQTVWSKIEQSDNWKGSSSVAVGPSGTVTTAYSLVRGISTPSLDGKSAKFFLGGEKPYSNAIWWNRLGSQDSATNFKLEISYYIKDPAASQGIEFAANQSRGGYRYKWSTQCSFAKGIVQVWDTYNHRWTPTTVPCKRPAAYTWTHITTEWKRENGKAVFVSMTINGQKHYINKSFSPKPFDASAINVHWQMNGNSVQKDYTTWVDNMKLTVW